MMGSGSFSRRAWLTAGAALGLGAGFAAWRYREADVPDEAVRGLFSETFQGLDGQPRPMAAYQGKPLLLNFWATWCPPCVEEMPLIDAFHKQNGGNVQVLGLAVDRADAVKSFLGQWPVGFDIALAGMAGAALSKTLGNPSGGLPFTVMVSSKGAIVHQKVGKLQDDDFDAMTRLLALG
jgi:thiol-disulfide isomerase/thioredoxin